MAIDFWDALIIASVMEVRDHLKNHQKTFHTENYYTNLKNEIAVEASDLFDVISDATQSADAGHVPAEIIQGGILLPTYAFLEVMQRQNSGPTPEQRKMISIYLGIMDNLGFSENEFFAAIDSNNSARRTIISSVGIDENSYGAFWQILFRASYQSDDKETLFSEIARKFSSIVVLFSMLGTAGDEVATPICERFIKSLQIHQSVYPESSDHDIDTEFESTYVHFFDLMKGICNSLVNCGDADDVLLLNLLGHFTVGLVYSYLEQCGLPQDEISVILDTVMIQCGVDIEIDGYTATFAISQPGEFRDLTYGMVHNWSEESTNYWKLFIVAAQKNGYDNSAVDFTKECSNFLFELGSDLAFEYPGIDFGAVGERFMLDIITQIGHSLI